MIRDGARVLDFRMASSEASRSRFDAQAFVFEFEQGHVLAAVEWKDRNAMMAAFVCVPSLAIPKSSEMFTVQR